MLTLKVANLWGPPSAGKSTTAAGLYNLMKHRGHRVELVLEAAKRPTYRKDFVTRDNQLYLLGSQDRRQRELEGQVEWVVTDSPIPIGLVYASAEYDFIEEATWGAYDRYHNYDVMLHRTKPYAAYGRTQTERESDELGFHIAELFKYAVDLDTDYALSDVAGDIDAPHRIYQWLMEGKQG